jgi:hypothetical protein
VSKPLILNRTSAEWWPGNGLPGEGPSRRYTVCWIDLPSLLIEPLMKMNRYPTGIGIVRRLENTNGSIPPHTVHREDRANGRT